MSVTSTQTHTYVSVEDCISVLCNWEYLGLIEYLFVLAPEAPEGTKWERNIPPPPQVSVLNRTLLRP